MFIDATETNPHSFRSAMFPIRLKPQLSHPKAVAYSKTSIHSRLELIVHATPDGVRAIYVESWIYKHFTVHGLNMSTLRTVLGDGPYVCTWPLPIPSRSVAQTTDGPELHLQVPQRRFVQSVPAQRRVPLQKIPPRQVSTPSLSGLLSERETRRV